MRLIALLLVGCLVWGVSTARADGPATALRGWGGQRTTTKASKKTKSPNFLTKMTSGPRRLLASTKNLLVPDKKPPAKKATVTNVRRHAKTKPQRGFFEQLFHPGPPPPPRTMGEWMALDQPRP